MTAVWTTLRPCPSAPGALHMGRVLGALGRGFRGAAGDVRMLFMEGSGPGGVHGKVA